jgi:hypothetical protein
MPLLFHALFGIFNNSHLDVTIDLYTGVLRRPILVTRAQKKSKVTRAQEKLESSRGKVAGKWSQRQP